MHAARKNVSIPPELFVNAREPPTLMLLFQRLVPLVPASRTFLLIPGLVRNAVIMYSLDFGDHGALRTKTLPNTTMVPSTFLSINVHHVWDLNPLIGRPHTGDTTQDIKLWFKRELFCYCRLWLWLLPVAQNTYFLVMQALDRCISLGLLPEIHLQTPGKTSLMNEGT